MGHIWPLNQQQSKGTMTTSTSTLKSLKAQVWRALGIDPFNSPEDFISSILEDIRDHGHLGHKATWSSFLSWLRTGEGQEYVEEINLFIEALKPATEPLAHPCKLLLSALAFVGNLYVKVIPVANKLTPNKRYGIAQGSSPTRQKRDILYPTSFKGMVRLTRYQQVLQMCC